MLHVCPINTTVNSVPFVGSLVLDDTTRIVSYRPTALPDDSPPLRSGMFHLAPGKSLASLAADFDAANVALSYVTDLTPWLPVIAANYLVLTRVASMTPTAAGPFPSGVLAGPDAVAIQIQNVIAAAAGVTTIWKDQNVNAPPLPYLALSMSGDITIGIDGKTQTQDITRPAGTEIEIATFGMREMTLQIEAFTAQSIPGARAASGLLSQLKTALETEPNVDVLALAGVSMFDPGTVDFVPAVVGTGFRGRGLLSIRCYVPAPFVVWYTGYIDDIRGATTATGEGGPYVVPFASP